MVKCKKLDNTIYPDTILCFINTCCLHITLASRLLLRFAESPVGFMQTQSLSCGQTHSDSSFLSCSAETCVQTPGCPPTSDRPAEKSNAPRPFTEAPAGQELNILQSEERQEEVCEVGCSAVSQAALWPVGEEKGRI